MKNLTLTALALTILPFGVFANEAPTVTDPVTGVETTVDQLDFQAMTPSQISDVRTQVQANAPDHARNMQTQMASQKDMQEADAGSGETGGKSAGMSGMNEGKGKGMGDTGGETAGAGDHGEGTGGETGGADGHGEGTGGESGSGNGGGNGGGMGGNGGGMGS